MARIKSLIGCVSALALAVVPSLALAAPPAIPPNAPGAPLDAYGNVPRANAGYAAPRPVPVCNGGNFSQGTGYVGLQGAGRTVYYCPQGAKSIQLLFSGAVLSSSGEADSVDPVAMKVSVEVNIPAPYDKAKAYAAGATVTSGGNSAQLVPLWTASQAVPAGAYPYNGSAYWAAATPTQRLTPVTCNGNPVCTQGQSPSAPAAQGVTSAGSAAAATTLTFAATPAGAAAGQYAYDRTTGAALGAVSAVSGTTVTVPALAGAVGASDLIQFLQFQATGQGVFLTDAIPVNCPVGCFIALRTRIVQTGPARFYSTLAQPYTLGTTIETGASVSDRTGTLSSWGFPAGAVGGTLGPVGIIGVPQVQRPTACVLGDSRTAGGTDYGVAAFAITAGGTGYVAGDVGTVVTLPAGVGTGAVGEPATLIVNQVTGGAVTSMRIVYGGQYNNPANNTGAGLAPSLAAQSPTGGSGSGLQVTVTSYTTTLLEPGDALGAIGMAQRALSENGYGFVGSMVGGDAFSKYAARDYTRMAVFAASGCSSAIVELGINDTTGGRTLAQMQADAGTIVGDLKGLGIKAVFLATLPPVAASTNGYIDTANQTASGANSVRVAWNNWVRGTAVSALGLRGYFEVADTVESARDSGLWAPNAAPCALTCGGTHSGAAGYAAEATGITAGLGMLQ